MAKLKFKRISDGINDGDYEAIVGNIHFSILRCVRPVRFALSVRRDGKEITGDTILRWGTLRALKERAQNILDREEARS